LDLKVFISSDAFYNSPFFYEQLEFTPPPLWQTDLICIKDTLKVFSNIFNVSGEGVAMMKGLSALGIIAAATLFRAAPVSLHWSPAKSPSLWLTLRTPELDGR